MKDESDDSGARWKFYEDLSGYEDEDEAQVVAPPATKQQAAQHPAAPKPAGERAEKPRPAKTFPRGELPDARSAKAMVAHGVPMADIVQEVVGELRGGRNGVMRARWLVGSMWRLGKATSSVVIFFEKNLVLGIHLRMRGKWRPIDAYGFDREKGAKGKDRQ